MLLRAGETPVRAFLRLAARVGEIGALLHEAGRPDSPGGAVITSAEARALIAEAEAATVLLGELAALIHAEAALGKAGGQRLHVVEGKG